MRHDEDLKLLMLKWICKSQTFATALREFTPNLEDFVRLTMLPMFGRPMLWGLS